MKMYFQNRLQIFDYLNTAMGEETCSHKESAKSSLSVKF